MKKTLVWGLAVGIGCGLVAWMYGVQGIRPALIVAAALGVAVAFRRFEDGIYRPWPDRPHLVVGGGTSTVSRLAQRLRRHTDPQRGPDPGVAHQLRHLIGIRLARRGLSVSDPRADDLLGTSVRKALLSDDAPDMATLRAMVAALDRLDRTDPSPSPQTDPRQGAQA